MASAFTDMIIDASLVPASEILSKVIEEINATVTAAKDVLIEQKSFTEVSCYLERIVPVLKELIQKNTESYPTLNKAIEILSREVKIARQLTLECSKRNRVYLLVSCRRIVKTLQDTTREISRALSLIPLASLDLSSSIEVEVNKLSDNMLKAEFKAAVIEEKVLEKIESGIQERSADRSYANNLLNLIAEAIGLSEEKSELKKVFDEFKREIADVQLRKNQAEAIQMDQIIALLGTSDVALPPIEREMKYYTKRKSLGNQPLEPLQSFYCPITRDVMVDPVETSSGQTFERSAIEKWLADGNSSCPLTMIPLDKGILRPNITLRKSIEEWKERNTMIMIGSMKTKLNSAEEQEILHCLNQLQELCRERNLHREWVVLENYIPVLVGFLGGMTLQIRHHALTILHMLAMDNDDNKERIAKEGNSFKYIVRSLGKRTEESKLAVALLLELSKHNVVLNHIGQAQGCILLLVALLKSNDDQASNDARELLENLSFCDENVIQMAKSNYFKPLLERLTSGSQGTKKLMAATLAEMELIDHSKSSLFDDGVLEPLLSLVSDSDVEVRQVAVKALYNLSMLPRNGLKMIREGAVRKLLHLLYLHNASSPTLREQVAATIMNLSESASSPEAGELMVPLLEFDDDIMKLFSLINLTGPVVQSTILRTFHALCKHPSASDMRAKLIQCSAVPVLVQLCEHNEHNDLPIRANALKLFYSLMQDGDDGTLSEHVGQRSLKTLLTVLETSNDVEEKIAAMGIISNLPRDHIQITQWLLDAEALPVVVKCLSGGQQPTSLNRLTENAVQALCRFTVATNPEWQKRAAEAGAIPLLIRLLGTGTALTKRHAAISLAQFSENSLSLSRRVERRGGLLCCSPPPVIGCPVHMGVCSVEESFCLVEAEAVGPLVGILEGSDFGASEAALRALSTLIEGERLQTGSKVISEARGITAIIKLLSSPSAELQEAALRVLERVFRLVEYKQKYNVAAQMQLIDITQRGTNTMKSLAAQILAHLNVIHGQSSYF